MILGICDRFHCLPSQAYEEGADILRLLKIEHHGMRREEEVECPT